MTLLDIDNVIKHCKSAKLLRHHNFQLLVRIEVMVRIRENLSTCCGNKSGCGRLWWAFGGHNGQGYDG